MPNTIGVLYVCCGNSLPMFWQLCRDDQRREQEPVHDKDAQAGLAHVTQQNDAAEHGPASTPLSAEKDSALRLEDG